MRFSESERRAYDRDGYVVRTDVFSQEELESLALACERVIDALVTGRAARRRRVGSYVFDPDFENETMIKWEGDSDVVHGIEPFAHLSAELEECGRDERLVDPMRDILPTEAPVL
ncbi:MAG: hypothetical protein P8Y95_15040, partial [Gammaproteobacteria bacterium]